MSIESHRLIKHQTKINKKNIFGVLDQQCVNFVPLGWSNIFNFSNNTLLLNRFHQPRPRLWRIEKRTSQCRYNWLFSFPHHLLITFQNQACVIFECSSIQYHDNSVFKLHAWYQYFIRIVCLFYFLDNHCDHMIKQLRHNFKNYFLDNTDDFNIILIHIWAWFWLYLEQTFRSYLSPIGRVNNILSSLQCIKI